MGNVQDWTGSLAEAWGSWRGEVEVDGPGGGQSKWTPHISSVTCLVRR